MSCRPRSSYNDDTYMATLTPYRLSGVVDDLHGDCEWGDDLSGNVMSHGDLELHNGRPMSIAPTVVSTTPAPGEAGVALVRSFPRPSARRSSPARSRFVLQGPEQQHGPRNPQLRQPTTLQ